jgi:hypothetical protein
MMSTSFSVLMAAALMAARSAATVLMQSEF